VHTLKFILAKLWSWSILAADDNIPGPSRINNFSKTLLVIGPIAYIIEKLTDWYITNEAFTHGNMVLIGLCALLGGIMHKRKGDFEWEKLLFKTIKMTILSLVVYTVIEIVISQAGDYGLVTAFRAALQVGTLLYPGTKILKNVYILSKGEYPPTWIMMKVYNFQESGDLKEFLGPVPPPYDSEIEDKFNRKFPKK
jgi:hypothetical protein